MSNFRSRLRRALREEFASPYRIKLLSAVLCAGTAASFWKRGSFGVDRAGVSGTLKAMRLHTALRALSVAGNGAVRFAHFARLRVT